MATGSASEALPLSPQSLREREQVAHVSQHPQSAAKGSGLPLMKAGDLGHRSKPFKMVKVEGRKPWGQLSLGSNSAGHF